MKILKFLLASIILLTIFEYGCAVKNQNTKDGTNTQSAANSLILKNLEDAKKYFNKYYNDKLLALSFPNDKAESKNIIQNIVNTEKYNKHYIKKSDTNGDGIEDLYEIDLNEDKIYDLAYKFYFSSGNLTNLYEQANAQIEIGISDLNRQQIPQAEEAFLKAIEIYFNNAEAHFYLGEILFLNKKNYTGALEKYRTSFKLDTSHMESINRIKQLNTILHLKNHLNSDPDSIENRMKLAKAYQSVPLPEEAILEYQRVRKVKPDNYLVTVNLADTYAIKGITEKAEALYAEAIKSLPEHPYAYRHLAELYKNKGIKNNGRDELIKAEKIEKELGITLSNPSQNKAEFINDIGEAFLNKGNIDTALSYFKKSFEMEKGINPKVNCNIGCIYFAKKNSKEAEKWYKMALEINKEYEPALIALGNLYYLDKNYNEAFNALKKAVQADPYNAEYYLFLGKMYNEVNMTEQAIDSFNKFIELDPFNKNAPKAKEFILKYK
ncbi:MAG: tetratricopeptide repeat protein [Candidatus Firestonebacteria bacterium]|nr:tetratricopeptide repeat protein [Candidatus Firestonebacteria bacterium]